MEKDPSAVLDFWHAAAARADEKAYFSAFHPDAVFLGTDGTERWTLAAFRTYAAPFFAKGRAWTLKPRDRRLSFSPDGAVAWFDETVDSPKYGAGRGTGVLLKVADIWKIVQYSYSVPIPNERLDAVLRLLKSGTP